MISAAAKFTATSQILDRVPTQVIVAAEDLPAARAILSGSFAKALWPGVNKYWNDHYNSLSGY